MGVWIQTPKSAMYVPQCELDCWGPDITNKDQVVTENGACRDSFKDEMNSCVDAIGYNMTHIYRHLNFAVQCRPASHQSELWYGYGKDKCTLEYSAQNVLCGGKVLILFYKVLQPFLF